MSYRIEKDSMGEVQVPADKYWGAQTQRSLMNFRIGPEASMPVEIIRAFGYLKKAAAITNEKFGLLSIDKMKLISDVCDEIIEGKLDDQFPLVIWQTGSGTHTNMNCNEVIANRAHVLMGNKLETGSRFIHPNDDVNMSQSSNDTFPTAMNLAAYRKIVECLIPALEELESTFWVKSKAMEYVVKIGRTHLMDATPITLGQEFSGYASQIKHGIRALKNTLSHLSELALGGTAVGTGLNAPKGYDAVVETHGAIKQLAVSLMKIGNDIRMSASGPRSGIGEISIPANEPGSSIMPGKVNPTQVEALTMVCARVMGNDTTITVAGSNGQFELNVFKPVMISAMLESVTLIADACHSFKEHCVAGIVPNLERIDVNLNNSLMLVTALNPHIGYDKAAIIAKKAFDENITLKEAAVASGYLTEKQFEEWVVPVSMT
jgi:fumarate hydratase class II